MQSFIHAKRTILLAAVLALFSLVMLAGSLKGLDFRPAQPFGGSSRGEAGAAMDLGAMIRSAAEIPFWQQVAFWAGMSVIVVLVASLLDPELRKKVILAFIRLAIFCLVFLYLVENNPGMFAGILERLTFGENLPVDPQATDAPAPAFHPPQVSIWISYALTLGLVLVFILSLLWLNRIWMRFTESSSTRNPLGDIARIARTSLGELRSGRDFENAIVECYARMTRVLVEKKGLHRENDMTPSEFSVRLTRAGLPREPVEKLTHMFENVRYGDQPAGQMQINEAVVSLTSILRYCGEEA